MAIKSIQKSFVFFDFSWNWFSLFLDFDRFWVATCRTLLYQPDLPETKTPIHQKLIPGPAECAKRSAAQRGRRAESLKPGPPDSSSYLFPDSFLRGSCLPPPKSSPGGCAFRRADLKTGGSARLGGSWAEKIAFQEAFKN